jgi:hypothetical protein
MDANLNFDRLRAWTEGTLPADERARFERELAADPAFARDAEEFRAVWNATAVGLEADSASRTSFDALARRLEPARETRWRRVAAAAVILIPVAALVWYLLASRTEVVVVPDVVKHSITTPREPAPVIPELLASWSPVQNGAIRWLTSFEEAREVSAAVGRPLFVFGYVQTCPICIALNQNEFRDRAVLDLVERSVPVAIDLMAADEATRTTLWTRRYPLLEIQDEHGTIVRTFGGQMADVDVLEELNQSLETIEAPSWDRVHELATTLARAKAAEERGDVGEASHQYESVARQHDAPVFARAGEAALERIASAQQH